MNSDANKKIMADLLKKSTKIVDDSIRPRFHFAPPACWMNDPNGTIFYNGLFHLFYQLNPYYDRWDKIHWGHAQSRDLVHWEHLPIALIPEKEKAQRIGDEAHCFSGCAAVDGNGTPLLFYTSVPETPDKDHRQAIARGSGDWERWEKESLDFLPRSQEGLPPVKGDWRDPYIFMCGDTVYLIIGAVLDNEGDDPVVLLFSATDTSLRKWEYRKILARFSQADFQFFECPNFFQIRDQWYLVGSPYQPVCYYVGKFDAETEEFDFDPSRKGLIDIGASFYATNTYSIPDGRTIIVAWIRDFPKGQGWNGCLSLPRELHADEEGRLFQKPVDALKSLRRGLVEISTGGDAKPKSPQFEVYLSNLNYNKKGSFSLRGEGREFRVSWSGGEVFADETLLNSIGNGEVNLYFDGSVMELFIDGGVCVLTRVLEELKPHSITFEGACGSPQVWNIASVEQKFAYEAV